MQTFTALSRKEQRKFSGWNVDGWVRWLAGLRGEYERRMTLMAQILEEGAFQLKQSTPVRDSEADWGVITKTRLLSFDWPRGGMFLWMRVHFEEHPLWQAKGGSIVPLFDGPALATGLFILLTHKPYLVIAGPGRMFGATPEVSGTKGWQFLRMCFAAESHERTGELTRRVVDGIQKFWRIKSKDEMEMLVDEYSKGSAAGLDDDASTIGFGFGC